MPSFLPAKKIIKPSHRLYDMCNFSVYRESTLERLPDDNAKKACINYVKHIDEFMSKRVGLYFYGGDQVGKAWRAGAIANYLLQRTYSTQLISASDLQRLWFKDEQWSDEQTLLERVRSVHVLVLLGLGKEPLNNYHLDRLSGFLTARKNEQNSVTLIASQFVPHSQTKGGQSPLEKTYGSEIASIIDSLTLPIFIESGPFHKTTNAHLKSLL